MSPEDSRHGTYAGYWQHHNDAESPCFDCRLASSRYNTNRDRQIAYGRWHPWVDAQSTREHVEHLRAAGMSIATVAAAAGVPQRRISHLLYGAGKRERPTKIRPDYAERVLSITPAPNRLPAFHVSRRIQALMAIGYSGPVIAERLGVSTSRANQLAIDTHPVMRSTFERVCAIYDDLHCVTPIHASRGASYARTTARKNGWHPPAAWDDIDDPSEQPDTGHRPKRGRGRPERMTTVLEDFDWLTSQGTSAHEAAARVGVALATVEDYRRRAGERVA